MMISIKDQCYLSVMAGYPMIEAWDEAKYSCSF